MNRTHLSFYLQANRIHVFTDALRGIGSPARICFLLERTGSRLLLLPYAKKDYVSHRVPHVVYEGRDSLDICSKKMCRLLADRHDWDVSRSYRIPGVIIPEKSFVVFDLAKAEVISKSACSESM